MWHNRIEKFDEIVYLGTSHNHQFPGNLLHSYNPTPSDWIAQQGRGWVRVVNLEKVKQDLESISNKVDFLNYINDLYS